MAVRVTEQIINPWKIISTEAMIFLGLIICTVNLTAMCYLYTTEYIEIYWYIVYCVNIWKLYYIVYLTNNKRTRAKWIHDFCGASSLSVKPVTWAKFYWKSLIISLVESLQNHVPMSASSFSFKFQSCFCYKGHRSST